MKCFYRNETLHKSDLTTARQNRKPPSRKQLAWGTAYATQHLEGRNSLFEGLDNVYLTCPSRFHPDRERADRSLLRRLQPLDRSSSFQRRASSADAENSILVRNAYDRRKGSRGEMGASTLAPRAERFGTHRSGRRHVVAFRVRLHDEHSERRACGADDDTRRRQGRVARSLRDAAAWPPFLKASDCGSR